MLSVHVGIASYVPTTYDTGKRWETILKLTLIKYHAPLSLPIYNMSSC